MSAARRKAAPDPATVARTLASAFQKGEPPRLTLVLAPARGEEEPWFAERILDAARTAGRADAGLDLLDVDAGSPDFEAANLDGFLGAASLFASRRALVLGRAGKALQKQPRLVEAIAGAAAAPDGPDWLVVHADGVAGAKACAALAKKASADGPIRLGRFRRLYGDPPPWRPDPDASEAAKFVAEEGRARGLRLERGAAGALVALAGARPGELVQALEHFDLLGTTSISEEDVRAVAAHSAEGSAFEFAEAVLTGDAPTALRGLQRLRGRGLRTWDGRRLGGGDAFSLLLTVLAKERARTAAVVAAVESGAEFSDACKSAGVAAGGPPAQRMQRRLERCGHEQLGRLLAGVRRAERRVKVEGVRDGLHVLEELAVHAHQRRRGRA